MSKKIKINVIKENKKSKEDEKLLHYLTEFAVLPTSMDECTASDDCNDDELCFKKKCYKTSELQDAIKQRTSKKSSKKGKADSSGPKGGDSCDDPDAQHTGQNPLICKDGKWAKPPECTPDELNLDANKKCVDGKWVDKDSA